MNQFLPFNATRNATLPSNSQYTGVIALCITIRILLLFLFDMSSSDADRTLRFLKKDNACLKTASSTQFLPHWHPEESKKVETGHLESLPVSYTSI